MPLHGGYREMRNFTVIDHDGILDLFGQISQAGTQDQADGGFGAAQLAADNLRGFPDLGKSTNIFGYGHVITSRMSITF
ncbi:hypothetical protein D3C72_2281900 [compost metagenome]